MLTRALIDERDDSGSGTVGSMPCMMMWVGEWAGEGRHGGEKMIGGQHRNDGYHPLRSTGFKEGRPDKIG